MYLYVTMDLASIGRVSGPVAFDQVYTATQVAASDFQATSDLIGDVGRSGATGVVVELSRSWLGRRHLEVAHRLLKSGREVYIYWVGDRVVERITRGTLLRLYSRWGRAALARRLVRPHFLDSAATEAGTQPSAAPQSGPPAWDQFSTALGHFKGGIADFAQNLPGLSNTRQHLDGLLESCRSLGTRTGDELRPYMDELAAGMNSVTEGLQVWERITANYNLYIENGVGMLEKFRAQVLADGMSMPDGAGSMMSEMEVPAFVRQMQKLTEAAQPVPFDLNGLPTPGNKVKGTGAYMRMDFWAPMISGGSYGHTCFVAKELANVTENMICLMGNRLPLIDEMGIRQVVVRPPFTQYSDLHILSANAYYYTALRPLFEANRPAYIYERLCLGNTVAARLSRDLGIPYILEYNGSEISLKRSFDGTGYQQEEAFLAAEAFSFAQATLISVVSDHIRDDLVARGIDPAKILVNPNCVDPGEYAPAEPQARRALRRELGFDDSHCVVGFIGTFGGWHGIDVLAASLKPIADACPEARFLLIGDGNFRYQVDEQIEKHGLASRVVMAGRVPQVEGARMLKACDIYVSPHNRHMVDGKFFGSPTKVFEYMAMEGGIVASDLEQMGLVLAPALRPSEVAGAKVTNQRSVLCVPGDLDDFVRGVVELARRRDLWTALGRNSRQAVIEFYSWRAHVENDFRFILNLPLVGYVADLGPKQTPAGH